ncbi:MAG: phosphate acyltransferase PlsX [Candidatus Aminicenantes bacterium]|nr:MAG: phosphate acyltransferase PlsX [Candidatus Aminicenantes bacterium]
MKVAVDAMGGDFGPRVTVEGALKASREYKIETLLVGIEDLIKKEYERLDHSKAKVTIINASEAIGMGEGMLSFRKKKKSSIRIGAELVKKGEAEAFVSTGNTGAVVYLSKKILGALKGVEKPALSLLVPNLKGLTLLIDVGANVNCRPHHLEQFGMMGHIFMESVLGLKNPRIGLMSIGEEDSKGNELTKEAFKKLQASPLNFIGNIEGKDMYSGKADIIVSDGFTGNVALKVSEGAVETFFYMARTELMKNFFSKIGLFLMKRHLKKIFKKIDYSEYGGAQLLGINGVCIIGHGRSTPNAVMNAVGLAKDFVQNKVQEKIQKGIANISHTIGKTKV